MEGGPEATRARGSDGGALVSVPQSSDTLALHSAPPAPGRTSHLAASTMLLTGHAAAVYCLQFNPTGDALASGSFDKCILLWDVYGEVRHLASPPSQLGLPSSLTSRAFLFQSCDLTLPSFFSLSQIHLSKSAKPTPSQA